MNKAMKAELVSLYQEVAKVQNKARAIQSNARAQVQSVKREVFTLNMAGANAGFNQALDAIQQAMDTCDHEFK